MFLRRMHVERLDAQSEAHPCPIGWIDNFAMRNFTNDAIFDDTLPVADGLIEIGSRVPEKALENAMRDWFRRKGYLRPDEDLRLTPAEGPPIRNL